MMKDKRKTYKELIGSFNREEKDDLHAIYCNSTVTITQLAKEYGVTIAAMRRALQEIMGEEGYQEAKLNRSAMRTSKSWRRYKFKHASTEKLFKVLKLLIDSDYTFFEISKRIGCSRERVGQIASDCAKYEISLNEDRGRMLEKKNMYGKTIRGYSGAKRSVSSE